MKIRRLIEELQKYVNMDADVMLHGSDGNRVLAVQKDEKDPSKVCILDRTDLDLKKELDARFKEAYEKGADEVDFFTGLFEEGFTLEDIHDAVSECYEDAKAFCEERGLL